MNLIDNLHLWETMEMLRQAFHVSLPLIYKDQETIYN